MKYNAMGKNRTYRLTVPQLAGGVNRKEESVFIDDDELADVCNMDWRNGALRTRKAVQAVDQSSLSGIDLNQSENGTFIHTGTVYSQPFQLDGKMCIAVGNGAGYWNGSCAKRKYSIQVITLNGEVLDTYTFDASTSVSTDKIPSFALAVCDIEQYGCAFLMFYQNAVYKPDKDTKEMIKLDDAEYYVPLVMINATSYVVSAAVPIEQHLYVPNGVMYEGFNVLTNRYRAQFTTNAEGLYEVLVLPTDITGSVTVDVATVYGTASVTVTAGSGEEAILDIGDGKTHKVMASKSGRISIDKALPVSDVSNNITVTCTAAESTKEKLTGASLAMWFGGTQNHLGGTRLFLSGFTTAGQKTKVMWSDVNDPLYFPENNFMYVGDPSQKVMQFGKQQDMLVIFKEREVYYTTYVKEEVDADTVAAGLNVDVTAMQASFPLTQLSPSIGCDCPLSVALCGDRLVWLCSNGRIYTLVNGGAYSERNVREIGAKILPHILDNSDESQRTAASAGDCNGRYQVLIGNIAYVFDYADAGFANLTSYSSAARAQDHIAWFIHRYAFSENATQHIVTDGANKMLILSTEHAKSNDWVKQAFVRTVYRTVERAEDLYADVILAYDGSVLMSTHTQPIHSCLTTKTYDFGNIAAFKRIKALFLSAQASRATVRCIADGCENSAHKYFSEERMAAHLLMPSIKRCQTLCITLESDAPVKIHGWQCQYTMFGTVR